MAALNAKQIPYKQPGVVASNYGFNSNNILSDQYLGRLRGNITSGNVNANNQAVWSALDKWFDAQAPQAKQSFLDWKKTGKFSGNYAEGRGGHQSMLNALTTAYDWAIRDQGREQQTKKPNLLGSIAKGLIGPVVGSLALGPAGLGLTTAALGGAAGGAIQGGVSDGLRGAALGGLQGYGVGSGINRLSNWWTQPAAPIIEGGTAAAAAPWTTTGSAGLSGWAPGAVSGVPDSVLWAGLPYGNAVPGAATGITTPTGGGLVGSGQFNPAGVGVLTNTAYGGGAPAAGSNVLDRVLRTGSNIVGAAGGAPVAPEGGNQLAAFAAPAALAGDFGGGGFSSGFGGFAGPLGTQQLSGAGGGRMQGAGGAGAYGNILRRVHPYEIFG